MLPKSVRVAPGARSWPVNRWVEGLQLKLLLNVGGSGKKRQKPRQGPGTQRVQAMFTIEDYGDSHEFRIFGEEYLKMKHFLVPNSFLFVRATIQPGWTNKEGVKGEPRLKFTEMKLLHDIMDALCKKITIKMPVSEIKENTILNLETILKNNPGTQSLHFSIWDAKEKIEVSLPSRNTKIKISNELLTTLERQHIHFKLN